MAQRDELNQRWKAEQEKARSLEKVNREMRAEKRHILSEYNKHRNRRSDDEEEEEKEDEERAKREKERKALIEEMEDIERRAVWNGQKELFSVSIVHVIITVLLMMAAYTAGTYSGRSQENGDGVAPVDNEEEIEMTKTEI